MPKQQLPITSPIGGISRVVNREGQSSSTCWDAYNVLPFDAYGRRRLAQRFGVSKQYARQIGTTMVQGMLTVNQIVYPLTLNSTGLPIYNSAQFTWDNVPGGWTVTPTSTHVPAGNAGNSPSPRLHQHIRPVGSQAYFAGTLEQSFSVTAVTPSTGLGAQVGVNLVFGYATPGQADNTGVGPPSYPSPVQAAVQFGVGQSSASTATANIQLLGPSGQAGTANPHISTGVPYTIDLKAVGSGANDGNNFITLMVGTSTFGPFVIPPMTPDLEPFFNVCTSTGCTLDFA